LASAWATIRLKRELNMTDLFILRHGIAVPHGTPGIPDNERPLTPKGERRLRQVGRGLAALKLNVDRIVTSPLPRALRTAQIVARELGLVGKLETSSILSAGADPHTLRDWLRDRPENRLMIVGHNPDLSELIGLLILGSVGRFPFELKKGGLAALTASPGTGTPFQLQWTAPAGLLRMLEGER
jgi:phosphohistidine phosphatase